jgi:hypothetical protein
MPVMSVFGWIFMMQRIGTSFSWDKTWSAYKNGFGTAGSDFWLGLERVHQLTQYGNYKLRVELLVSGIWKSAEYWTFILGDEVNTQYTMKCVRVGASGNVRNDSPSMENSQ